MILFVTSLHVLLSISLVLVILLQPSKDGSAALGGGVNSMYGPRGNAHPLGRATTIIAMLFMFTSITLAYESTARRDAGSDFENDIRKLEDQESGIKAPPPLEAAPTDAVPTDAVPTDAVPTDAVPTDAVPTDAVPTDAAPADAAPAAAAPTDAVQKDAAPAGAAPASGAPAESAPAGK